MIKETVVLADKCGKLNKKCLNVNLSCLLRLAT